MSTLQVANIHLESTGNNRIQYNGSNSFVFVTAGSNAMTLNSTSISFTATPTFSSLTIGNSVITNTNISVGNSTVNGSLSDTSIRVGNSTASFTTNSTGIYHTGTINLSSYTVGTNFTANSTLVNAVSIVTSTNTVTLGTTVYVVAGGNVGISNTAPADKLHVQGNIIASGDITSAFSDERLKEITGPITNALEKVNSLIGFYYKPNETALQLHINDELKVGVSAQQVQKVLPEIVKPSAIDPKYLTVQYEKLVPLLIEAIKELTVRIEELENGS